MKELEPGEQRTRRGYKLLPSGLTEREEKAAVERLGDPAAPNEEILRRAGYAESTLSAAKRNGLNADKLARRFQEAQGIRPAEAQKIGLETLTELARGGEQESTRGASAKTLLDWSQTNGGADERPDLGAAQAMLLYRKRRLALRLIGFCLRSPERAQALGQALAELLVLEDAEALRVALRDEVLGKP